nr:MAG TPA: hypothetical protein [Caudoviricetes sp.]
MGVSCLNYKILTVCANSDIQMMNLMDLMNSGVQAKNLMTVYLYLKVLLVY